MAYSCRSNLLIVTIFIAACFITVTARPLSSKPSNLAARLKLVDNDGGEDQGSSTKCWDSLFELQSCTGEVILFFLNGETYLGPGCCNAIRNIEHQCWPSMLGSLGFTSQEGDILLGYCDGTASGSHATTTTPPKVSNATANTRVSQGMLA